MNLSLEYCPTPNPKVIFRMVDAEAVLVNPEQGKVQVLNEVGAHIWGWMDGLRSLAQLAEKIAEEYEVELAEAQADTLAFCEQLMEKGLCS